MYQYKTVFIAEDEPVVLLGIKAMLTQLGYTVVGQAFDGREAVTQVLDLNPDFLLMDIKMPGKDGITALSEINARSRRQIPCIFISAFTDDAIITRANNAGAFCFLVKPIKKEDLKATIKIALQRHSDYMTAIQERNQFRQNLQDRKIIERAKGLLMDNFGMTEKAAMDYLQKKSRNTNKKLVAVAQSILKIDEELQEK